MLNVISELTLAALAAEPASQVQQASAAAPVDLSGIAIFGALIGAGIIVFGAASGIGRLASSATEAIARQPEAGGRIFTTMLLAGALIEGVAFFALIVCFMAILWLK